jgi:glutathione S-transferase
MYGDRWSIVDVYLCWLMGIAALGGAPGVDHVAITEHVGRVRARPSFVRALARENAAVERCNIPLPPGVKL